jgi:hypothetical protein
LTKRIIAFALTTVVILYDYACKPQYRNAMVARAAPGRSNMENAESARFGRSGRTRRRRTHAEKIETALIVALAGLVLLLGARALAGIASGIKEMMMAVTRL